MRNKKKILVYLLATVFSICAGLTLTVWDAVRYLPASVTCFSDSADPRNPPKTLKVLFIGNSLIFSHEMPALFSSLVTNGQLTPAKICEITGRGFSFRDHLKDGLARKVLVEEGPWDIVILQPASRDVQEMQADGLVAAKQLISGVDSKNSAFIILQIWSNPGDTDGKKILTAGTAYGAALNCKVLPIGLAWAEWYRNYPNLTLHDIDNYHPGARGALLDAYLSYAYLLKQKPPPTSLDVLCKSKHSDADQRLTEKDAEKLREFAWQYYTNNPNI